MSLLQNELGMMKGMKRESLKQLTFGLEKSQEM